MDDFNEALQKIGQHIYQQAGDAAGASSPEADSDGQGEKKKEEDVVDADYREVN